MSGIGINLGDILWGLRHPWDVLSVDPSTPGGKTLYKLASLKYCYIAALHDDSLMGTSAPSMGRITGSASIETLVRVGIEKENGLGPESKMVVLHDFTPCVDDELEVKRGQVR